VRQIVVEAHEYSEHLTTAAYEIEGLLAAVPSPADAPTPQPQPPVGTKMPVVAGSIAGLVVIVLAGLLLTSRGGSDKGPLLADKPASGRHEVEKPGPGIDDDETLGSSTAGGEVAPVRFASLVTGARSHSAGGASDAAPTEAASATKLKVIALETVSAPESATPAKARGDALYYLGRYEEAQVCYERALAEDGEDWLSRMAAGRCAHEMAKYDKAFGYFDLCVQQLDAEAERAGEPAESWRQRPEVGARYAEAYGARGYALVKGARFREAVTDCERAVRLYEWLVEAEGADRAQGLAGALSYLASARAGLEDYGGAFDAYGRAISRLAWLLRAQPDSRVRFRLGWVLTKRGELYRLRGNRVEAKADFDQAVDWFEALKRDGADEPPAHAWALRLRSTLGGAKALDDAGNAVTIEAHLYQTSPGPRTANGLAITLVNLGDRRRDTGDFGGAIAEYERAKKLPGVDRAQVDRADAEIRKARREQGARDGKDKSTPAR
jgi:tetratricopeptide (TPR) repeat protein